MGRLIVIDGLDGSGKTTQFERVDQWLTRREVSHRCICFPQYDDPSSALVKLYLSGAFGDDPDAVNAYAASSCYAVDRYASYKRYWEREYRQGQLILAARYTTSNALHQMPKLPRDQWDGYLRWLTQYEYEQLQLPRPDRVLLLDVPPVVSQELMTQRYAGDEGKKDIHERDVAYLERCRQAALYAARKEKWQVIACTQDDCLLPVEAVTQLLLEAIQSYV